MAKPKNKLEVTPLIKVEGETNILQKVFDGDPEKIPELKAIGYAPIGAGSGRWISYVLTFKGPNILSITASEPDQRAIAEESAKIDFVNSFMVEGI